MPEKAFALMSEVFHLGYLFKLLYHNICLRRIFIDHFEQQLTNNYESDHITKKQNSTFYYIAARVIY